MTVSAMGIATFTRLIFSTCVFLIAASPTPILALDETSLITNIKSSRELESGIQEVPLRKNVYDLSFTAYDADFANEFGLKNKNITELDTGLRFIELRMITEGAQTNCYYNVVLDKSLKLDFPEEDFDLSNHLRFNYPWNYQKDGVEKITINKRSSLTGILFDKYGHYMNRTGLGNKGYTFHKTGKPFRNGSASSALIQAYIYSRNPKYSMLRVKGMCIGKMYDHPNFSLWLRKKGHDSSKGLNKDDYHVLVIPESITNRIKPISEQIIKRKNNNKKQGE